LKKSLRAIERAFAEIESLVAGLANRVRVASTQAGVRNENTIRRARAGSFAQAGG
jgi:hypothetical protein